MGTHTTDIIDVKKLIANLKHLDFDNLSEEEYVGVKYLIDSNYDKYNIRVLSHITPDLFSQFINSNQLYIFKYARLFFQISQMEDNPLEEHHKELYQTIIDAVIGLDQKILHYLFLKYSYRWTYEMLERYINPHHIYDKTLLVSAVSSHPPKIAAELINNLMILFNHLHLEFVADGIPFQYFNPEILKTFRANNTLINLGD